MSINCISFKSVHIIVWVYPKVVFESSQVDINLLLRLSSSPHGFTNSQFPNFEFRIFGLACFLFVKTIIRDWELGLCETICYILRRSQKVDGILPLMPCPFTGPKMFCAGPIFL